MTLIKKTNFGADVILSASTQTPPRESNIFTKGSGKMLSKVGCQFGATYTEF